MRDLLKSPRAGVRLAAGSYACDSEKTQAAAQPPPDSITGRERLGWDQQAPDADELQRSSYVLYVDGVGVVLPDATCGALAGEGPSAACSSPLPPLQPGRRTLELVTRITRDGTVLESVRSAPLVVTVAGSALASATASADAPRRRPGRGARRSRGPDGTPYVIETVASGLDRPSALAEAAGRPPADCRAWGPYPDGADGVLLATPAAVLSAGADPDADEGVSLAVAPDFESTRHVYVSYVALDAGGARAGRVVRLREAGGTLGEAAAVISTACRRVERAPRIRFGPDGALYVGTTAVDTRDADNLGSYAGKILRFTAAGGTPSDNPTRSSPVFSSGHRGRLDFDWEPASQGLWSVEAGPRGVLLRRADSGSPGARSAFLDGIQAASAAFHAGATPAAWRGSLFLASPEDACLYRVSGLASAPPVPVVERLLAGSFGRITAVPLRRRRALLRDWKRRHRRQRPARRRRLPDPRQGDPHGPARPAPTLNGGAKPAWYPSRWRRESPCSCHVGFDTPSVRPPSQRR